MDRPLTPDEKRDRLVFYPVAVVAGIFCLTVFMTIAAVFGDPQAPFTRWMNRNATPLLLWETALLVTIGILAMTIDRLRTLQRIRREQSSCHSNKAKDLLAPQSCCHASDTDPDPGDR